MLSAILPIYNEEQGIEAFAATLISELKKCTTSFELIFVNDVSTDNSL